MPTPAMATRGLPFVGAPRFSPFVSASLPGGSGKRDRQREREAKTPWYRTRFEYGAGASAASRRENSVGSRTRHVAPAPAAISRLRGRTSFTR